jgi:hypothetical protein
MTGRLRTGRLRRAIARRIFLSLNLPVTFVDGISRWRADTASPRHHIGRWRRPRNNLGRQEGRNRRDSHRPFLRCLHSCIP